MKPDLGRILKNPSGFSEQSLTNIHIIEQAAMALIRSRAYTGRPVLSSWNVLLDYIHANIAHSPIEMFHVFYLDRKNVLIADETLSSGTIDFVSVYPREVLRRVIHHNASAVILTHNHPSGDPTPSEADIEMTRTVAEGLSFIGGILHDHVIVGHGGDYSFRSHGDL